jgi:hypothetical protein
LHDVQLAKLAAKENADHMFVTLPDASIPSIFHGISLSNDSLLSIVSLTKNLALVVGISTYSPTFAVQI